MFAITYLGLPESTLPDLFAVVLFGVASVFVVALGVMGADWAWKKLDLEEQVQKGNIAAGMVMVALILGYCYVMATVAKAIIGG